MEWIIVGFWREILSSNALPARFPIYFPIPSCKCRRWVNLWNILRPNDISSFFGSSVRNEPTLESFGDQHHSLLSIYIYIYKSYTPKQFRWMDVLPFIFLPQWGGIIHKIVEAADIQSSDAVYEVKPTTAWSQPVASFISRVAFLRVFLKTNAILGELKSKQKR